MVAFVGTEHAVLQEQCDMELVSYVGSTLELIRANSKAAVVKKHQDNSDESVFEKGVKRIHI